MVSVESPFPPGMVMFPTGVTPRFHEFYDALDAMHVPEGSAKLRLGGPDCDTNRNKAIRIMPEASIDPDWVLFLDDDQTPEPDSLMRMLYTLAANPDIDALTGWYVRKKIPFQPVLYRRDTPSSGQAFERLTFDELTAARKQGPLLQIGACGGGMLLVRRRTLDRIGDPWFTPGPGRQWGGDIGFGWSMAKLGMKLVVDLSLSVGHAMPSVITPIWDDKDQKWYLRFSHGSRGFRVPAEHFKQEPEGD